MGTTATVLKGKITDLPNSRGFEMHNGDTIEAKVRFRGLEGENLGTKLPVRVTGSEGRWREVGAKIMGTTVWKDTRYTVTITMTDYFTESAQADFEMEEETADRDTAKD